MSTYLRPGSSEMSALIAAQNAPMSSVSLTASNAAHQLTAPVTPFHRQFHDHPRHRWFSPLLVVLLFVLFYAVMIAAVIAGSIFGGMTIDEGAAAAWWDQTADMNTMVGLVAALVSIILFWPAAELATYCIYRTWLFTMFSVARTEIRTFSDGINRLVPGGGGLRWSLLARYLVIGLVVLVVCTVVRVIASPGSVPAFLDSLRWNDHVHIMIALVLVLVPFQAMSEEIVLRGLAMNVIGSWLRRPLWAILLPIPVFVLGHIYDLPGLIFTGIFAAVMGALTIYLAGLEAAIAFHAVNNVMVFGFDIFTGGDLNATSFPPLTIAVSMAGPILFAFIVVFDKRRRDRRVSVR